MLYAICYMQSAICNIQIYDKYNIYIQCAICFIQNAKLNMQYAIPNTKNIICKMQNAILLLGKMFHVFNSYGSFDAILRFLLCFHLE